MEGLRCTHCGANAASPTARFCEYCGKALANTAPRQPSPEDLLQQRFADLENHPELQRHLEWTPGPEVLKRRTSRDALTPILLVALLCAVPAFRGHMPMPAFPVVLACVLIAHASRRRRGTHDGPLERLMALVADERQSHFGRGNSPGGSEFLATLETRDGARRELELSGPLAGEIHPGDMGVAYVKGGVLIAFRRLRT